MSRDNGPLSVKGLMGRAVPDLELITITVCSCTLPQLAHVLYMPLLTVGRVLT